VNGHDFRIKIAAATVECEYHSPKARNQTFGSIDLKVDPYLETVVLLELWLKRWHRIRDSETRVLADDTFRVLGEHLWKLALDNSIGARIIETIEMVRKLPDEARPPVRIRISVTDDDRLGTLPWEFIRSPERPGKRPFFLASEADVVLGRWVGDASEVEIRAADTVVRILFVMSLPDEFAFGTERKRFHAMLDELYHLKRGKEKALDIVPPIDTWQPGEVESVLRKLTTDGRQIDVVHLVAVCRNDGRNGSKLLLGREGGRDVFGSPDSVIATLIREGSTLPTLVVLHLSDYWHDDEVSEHFERLAPEFVKAGIPAVLAMQYPMTDGKDVAFLKSFYQKLTNGQSIGSAVQNARRELKTRAPQLRHFGAPVLYLQTARDGFLLDALESEGPAAGHEGRSTIGARTSGPTGIRERLLDWGFRGSPDWETSMRLSTWINRKSWPDDTPEGWDTARKALQGRRREDVDDEALRSVYDELLARVDEHLDEMTSR
jgi:hypothetical protein